MTCGSYTLSKGMSDDCVLTVRDYMIKKGFLIDLPGLTVAQRRVFDDALEAAVVAFQTANHITHDGKVGGDSWAIMQPSITKGVLGVVFGIAAVWLSIKLLGGKKR